MSEQSRETARSEWTNPLSAMSVAALAPSNSATARLHGLLRRLRLLLFGYRRERDRSVARGAPAFRWRFTDSSQTIFPAIVSPAVSFQTE